MRLLQGVGHWPLLGLVMGTFNLRWGNMNESVCTVTRSSSGKRARAGVKYSSLGNAFLNYKLRYLRILVHSRKRIL